MIPLVLLGICLTGVAVVFLYWALVSGRVEEPDASSATAGDEEGGTGRAGSSDAGRSDRADATGQPDNEI